MNFYVPKILKFVFNYVLLKKKKNQNSKLRIVSLELSFVKQSIYFNMWNPLISLTYWKLRIISYFVVLSFLFVSCKKKKKKEGAVYFKYRNQKKSVAIYILSYKLKRKTIMAKRVKSSDHT